MRDALRLAGRREGGVALPDGPSLGPTAAAAADRAAWSAREIGKADRREDDAARSASWSAALDPGKQRVAWWSRRPAQEYRGFLASVSRSGDDACDAVCLAEAPTFRPVPHGATPGNVAGTLAVTTPEAMLANGLLDRAEPPAPERRAGLLGLWSRLQAEDAPLRVPTGGSGQVSAPFSFLDDEPPRRILREWRRTARTVAEALAVLHGTRMFQAGVLLLAARVHALAAAGRIELRGGDPRHGLAGTELRLAAPTAPP